MTIRINKYNELIKKYSENLSKIRKTHTLFSIFRLLVFIIIVLFLTIVLNKNITIGILGGLTGLIVFIYLIKRHKKIEDKKLFTEKLLEVNQHEKDVCLGNYSFFENGKEFIDTNHEYSYDLDLFGDKSLFQYLNRTVTFAGKQILAKWLIQNSININETKDKQKATMELAEMLKFRQNFIGIGKIYYTKKSEKETVTNWLKSNSIIKNKTLIKILLYAIPIFNLSILVAVIIGVLNWKLLIYLIVANLLLLSFKIKKVNAYNSFLSEINKIFTKNSHIIQLIENQCFKSKTLSNLYSSLFVKDKSATYQIKQLNKLLEALDNRNNILIGFILNSFLLWDWQCIYRIDKWKKEQTTDIENWLNTIAIFDALISLANFSYNNPNFTLPEFNENVFEFTAKQMGHPLILKKQRVCNNFSLDKNQRYAIITGANMAGKSTFLRSVAINLILAKAGTVVCAESLKLSPIPLFSGMRAEDSLSKNESYFFAELKRLQRITNELDKGEPMFIILDEILRGTNSEDKRKGSIGFVKKIIKQKACGLIATHDLELARLVEQQPNIFKAMCFEVKIQNDILKFDYKLTNGVTQNMNASFLMKKMGII